MSKNRLIKHILLASPCFVAFQYIFSRLAYRALTGSQAEVGAEPGKHMISQMPRIMLTPSAVMKTAVPTTGDRLIYWDQAMPGFGLQVTADNHRSYVYQYRALGISRRVVLDGSFLAYEAKRDEERNKKNGARSRDNTLA